MKAQVAWKSKILALLLAAVLAFGGFVPAEGPGLLFAAEESAAGMLQELLAAADEDTAAKDVATIAEAIEKAGERVRITGIPVYNIRNGGGTSDNGVYMQDATAGIDLYGGNGVASATSNSAITAYIGKEIEITGKISDYNGLMELMLDSSTGITVINENPDLPEPKQATVQDILNKTYPFMLVSMNDVKLVSKDGTYASGHNSYTIEQDGKQVTLYGPAVLAGGIEPGDYINIKKAVSSVSGNKPQVYVNSDSAADIVLAKPQEVKATPDSGKISLDTAVTLSVGTEGASIKYKIDDGAYQDYTGPIKLTVLPATITAYAVKDGANDGNESVFEYEEKVAYGALTHYYGQLHAHTSNSDGTGSYGQAFNYAKDTAGLDFFAVTDHSNNFDSASDLGKLETGGGSNSADNPDGMAWSNGRAAADDITTDGEFIGIMGFEMTWSNTAYGHINTFNTDGYVSRNNKRYTDMANGQGLKNYYDDMADYSSSISQFNHPGVTFGSFTDFAYYTEERDENINLLEVGNGDGTNSQLNNGYWRSESYYDRALSKGWHVAPANNQDNHKANWGTSNDHRTIVLATELTREAIYEAIDERRVYSSENKTMKVDYTLNGEAMGSILGEQNGDLDIKISASNTEETLGEISLVGKNGVEIKSKEVDLKTDDWEFTIPDTDDFYYVKIEQPNGDMTLTAPIWVGGAEIEKQGITDIKMAAGTPMSGQPIGLTTTIFNDADDADFVITSITYTNEEGKAAAEAKTDKVNVKPQTLYDDVITITPVYGNNAVNVTVKGSYSGTEKTFTEKIFFTAVDGSGVAKIVIDAAHKNIYAGGQYPDGLESLAAYAEDLGIAFVWATEISDAVLDGASGFIVTTPQNRSTGETFPYTDAEIAAVKKYAESGGNLLLMARADYGEGADDLRTHVIMNGILEQFGLTTKINGDELCLNDIGTYQFGIPAGTYTDNGILAGLDLDKEYRVYSASGLVGGERTVPLIYGIDGMFSYDSANKGDAVSNASGSDMLVLAQEETAAGGVAYIAGSTFCSSFESDTSQFDNFIIAKAMLESFVGESGSKITPIAEARQGSEGTPFTVRGIVTSSSNSFFDCIYVQDETGGICIHPVNELGLEVGQEIIVKGAIKSYLGDIELGIMDQNMDITVLGTELKPLQPKNVRPIGDSMKAENQGWLARLFGTVTEISNDGSIYIKDATGSTARIFIDGYTTNSVTGESEIDSRIAAGAKISAVGLSSVDSKGPRLRVRDLAEVVFDDGTVPENKPTMISAVLGEDAQTSAHFAWHSDSAYDANVDPVESIVLIAKKSDMTGDAFPFASAKIYAGTQWEVPEGNYANRVSAEDLSAGTEYVYVVGNGTEENWSEIGSIKTDSGAAAFDFVYVSDAQTASQEDGEIWAENLGKAVDKASDPEFILHLGDQIDTRTAEEQYEYFFTPQDEFLDRALMTAVGNHDMGSGDSESYTNHFVTPGNGPVEGSYWYMYGETLFIILNPELSKGYTAAEQVEWMKKTAAENEHRWLIIGMHRDVYSVASHYDDSDVAPRREALIAAFDEIGADLVLQGHDHSFLRSYVMRGGVKQTETIDAEGYSVNPNGTVYMTLGSPSDMKQYDYEDNEETQSYTAKGKSGEAQYAVIDAAEDTLRIRTYDAKGEGELYDEYKIRKTALTHKVTFSAAGNGTLTASAGGAAIPSGAAVKAGSDIVFTATPASGYQVSGWSVNGVSVGSGASIYTLKDISKDAAVTVSFSAVSSGGNNGGGGGGSGSSSSSSSRPSTSNPSTSDKNILDQLKDGETKVTVNTDQRQGTATISSNSSKEMISKGADLVVKSGQNAITIDTETLKDAGGESNAVRVTARASSLPVGLKTELDSKNPANAALSKESSITLGVSGLDSFDEPLKVSFDASSIDLPGTLPSKLSAVFIDPQGNLTVLKSVYENGLISYNADKPGNYAVLMLGNDRVSMVQGASEYSVNGDSDTMGVAPELVDSSVMVPARFIVEGLNGKVDWDDVTKTVTFSLNGRTTAVAIGQRPVQDAPAAYISNDRTMVPLRYVTESLGCFVSYNHETKAIDIFN